MFQPPTSSWRVDDAFDVLVMSSLPGAESFPAQPSASPLVAAPGCRVVRS
jgi:hypothetical protein